VSAARTQITEATTINRTIFADKTSLLFTCTSRRGKPRSKCSQHRLPCGLGSPAAGWQGWCIPLRICSQMRIRPRRIILSPVGDVALNPSGCLHQVKALALASMTPGVFVA
jgi:hypothetical protein